MSIKILAVIKKCLILVVIQLRQNTMIIQTNQSSENRKNQNCDVAITEFVGMKPKMYSLLVDDKSEHKIAKQAYRIFETLSRNEYKDVLLNNTFLRHSMNRIQSKDHIIGKYEINKI